MFATLLSLLLGGSAHGADVQGITVATPTWGWEWGTEQMDGTLDQLVEVGATWVAIHPYARIHADGRVTHGLDPDAPPPAWLARPIAEAHARGLKILIKPHLAYWGSPFSWRGEIAFEDATAQATFFRTYTAWVVRLASLTPEADGFVVGTELGGTVHHEDAWRAVIADVRGVTKAPLTYAANWDRLDGVPFWDAVDVVGVQAYFPVIAGGSADTVPAESDVRAGWATITARLRELHRRTGKHIVLTELGYDRAGTALTQPWKPGREGTHGRTLQTLGLSAALDAIEDEPSILGAFLWNWMVGEVPTGHFRLPEPHVRAVLRDAWNAPPATPDKALATP